MSGCCTKVSGGMGGGYGVRVCIMVTFFFYNVVHGSFLLNMNLFLFPIVIGCLDFHFPCVFLLFLLTRFHRL